VIKQWLQCMKITTIIGLVTKRKHKHKELFKLNSNQIKMIEDNYYYKFNKEYYKQNIKSIG